jgi:(S)-mandelate dehydrogenase
MNIQNAVNLDEVRLCAKARLPKIAFDFIDGGVHDEHGLATNRDAFRRYCLLPRYLTDVSNLDQSVEVFGKIYSSPVGIAPMGIAGLFRPGADLMLAEAAADANVPYVMSSASCDSIEKAAKVAPENTWFQVYGTRNPEITRDLVQRATYCGVKVLVLTIDTPTLGGRERNIRNGFTRPMKLRPEIVLQGIMHPAWALSYMRNGGAPLMENWAPYAKGGAEAAADLYGRETPAPGQTWVVLEAIRAIWKGPLVVKGVLSPGDARRCAECGANGIIISNHGGRQLDRAPSPIEMIAAIRAAVGNDIVLGMDSGIRRGSDVVIAACLGITFALIGRPALFGVAAGGKPGGDKVLKMMRGEIDNILAQIGAPRFSELNSDFVLDRFDGLPSGFAASQG